MFWAADYGNLTFTSDHGLYTELRRLRRRRCGALPGRAPPRPASRPTTPSIRTRPGSTRPCANCDMRGSVLAYSGSMGNAVRITRNHIYGNTAGISTDTISAAGHPGFPADSVQIDHNYIYSNNLEPLQAERAGRAGRRRRAGRHRHLLGRPQQRPRPRQLDLGQLAQRRLPALGPGLPGDPGGHVQPGRLLQGAGALDLLRQPLLRQPARSRAGGLQGRSRRCASSATGSERCAGARPNGVDFWWDEGGVGIGRRQLLVRQHRAERQARVGSPAPAPATGTDKLPSNCAKQRGQRRLGQGRLPALVLPRARGRRAAGECDWYTLPPKPGSLPRPSASSARSPRGRARS